MINIYKYEEKDEESCRMKCYDELDVYDDEIITKEYEESNKYIIEVLKINEIRDYIENYISDLLKKMNIKATINVDVEDKIFNVKIKGKDNAILIGKDGKNMSALQLLIRQTLRSKTKFNIKVNIDISNYKQRKEHLFERDIKEIINEVLTSKTDTTLEPMNSYKRRIVHNVAGNYYNIETKSDGEEPNRCVTIKYIEN